MSIQPLSSGPPVASQESSTNFLSLTAKIVGSLALAYFCRLTHQYIQKKSYERTLHRWSLKGEGREQAVKIVLSAKPINCDDSLCLDFTGLELTELPPIGTRAEKVVVLIANENCLPSFSSLLQFKNLRSLDLSDNKITDIPNDVFQWRDDCTITLNGNTLSDATGQKILKHRELKKGPQIITGWSVDRRQNGPLSSQSGGGSLSRVKYRSPHTPEKSPGSPE